MILPHQDIIARCTGDFEGHAHPLISPFLPEKTRIEGMSAGVSHASYDCRIDHDLVLGIDPGIIIARHLMKYGFSANNEYLLQRELEANPPMRALAHTVEDFYIHPDLSGAVCDKSSYARVFVTAFNTFFDLGFHGNATLELVNLGEQPVIYKTGNPVCQFIFSQLTKPTDKPYDGKYQHQTKAAHGTRYEHADGSGYTTKPPAATYERGDGTVLTKHVAVLDPFKSHRNDRQHMMTSWIEGIWTAAALHPNERVERVYEETCELAQAEHVPGGLLHGAATTLVTLYDQGGQLSDLMPAIEKVRKALRDDRLSKIAAEVYAKPVSTSLAQEVGGISTCLLAYGEMRNLSVDYCEASELARILALSKEHFRERHARKIASGLALPLVEPQG